MRTNSHTLLSTCLDITMMCSTIQEVWYPSRENWSWNIWFRNGNFQKEAGFLQPKSPSDPKQRTILGATWSNQVCVWSTTTLVWSRTKFFRVFVKIELISNDTPPKKWFIHYHSVYISMISTVVVVTFSLTIKGDVIQTSHL